MPGQDIDTLSINVVHSRGYFHHNYVVAIQAIKYNSFNGIRNTAQSGGSLINVLCAFQRFKLLPSCILAQKLNKGSV